jgi:two-component system sensor histidine kinase/response regulator
VFDIDLVADTVLWSDKLVSMMGLPMAGGERSQAEWRERLHPEDRERAVANFAHVLASGATDLRDSWRIVRPDGDIRWFLSAARVFRDAAGKPVRVVGVNVDIHDQKLLEAQVAEQLDFQQALIDAVPVPLFYKGADGRYIGFNRAYEQAFGVQREALIGKTVLDLGFLPEADRERFDADAARALEGVQSVHKEVDLPYADGNIHHTLFWLHLGGRHRDVCGHHRSAACRRGAAPRQGACRGIHGAQVQLPGQHEP